VPPSRKTAGRRIGNCDCLYQFFAAVNMEIERPQYTRRAVILRRMTLEVVGGELGEGVGGGFFEAG
jgi:hypothetical protein